MGPVEIEMLRDRVVERVGASLVGL